MEKYNNWKLKFYTIWAGQAVSLITSAILQMAIIFYLTEKVLMNHQNRSVQDGALRQYSGLSNGMRFSQAWMHFLRYSLRFPSKAIQPQAFAAAAFPLLIRLTPA